MANAEPKLKPHPRLRLVQFCPFRGSKNELATPRPANGTLPTLPNFPISSPVVSDTVTIGPNRFLRLAVPKNPTATRVQYEVQATSDLALPMSWSAGGLIIELDNATALRVRDNVPMNSGTPAQHFLRVFVD